LLLAQMLSYRLYSNLQICSFRREYIVSGAKCLSYYIELYAIRSRRLTAKYRLTITGFTVLSAITFFNQLY